MMNTMTPEREETQMLTSTRENNEATIAQPQQAAAPKPARKPASGFYGALTEVVLKQKRARMTSSN